ncbi:hypothetical protein SDC9_60594 [bioreactor metagenome]|uniref:Histidine kinase/HSP90-like ATPase domain-containing protein n=1 Tax=bioreactor metagenome TaxID=1076179 RepID=A0A644XJ41_9ZZZZ
MAKFIVPTEASIHTSFSFLEKNSFFDNANDNAILEFNPFYMHLEPIGLAMISAWGAWCRRHGKQITANNLSKRTDYAARMKLFQQLGIDYTHEVNEHEEIGRFMPLRNVRNQDDIRSVIADVSALLHLGENPDSLAAVQYCLSELLRNVIEHSGSPEGAFVCAHNYTGKGPHRVTLAVADCGCGITQHLGRKFEEIKNDDITALQMAMMPGITGVIPGMYGTSDNAGAGLFITRCIAKGTGGYFEIISGKAAYRLRRTQLNNQAVLFNDPFFERCDVWDLTNPWQGTVVTIEIKTEMINDFESYFGWIKEQIPPRVPSQKRIIFT